MTIDNIIQWIYNSYQWRNIISKILIIMKKMTNEILISSMWKYPSIMSAKEMKWYQYQ